jgi:competence protein ComEA
MNRLIMTVMMKLIRVARAGAIAVALLLPLPLSSQVTPLIAGAVEAAQVDINNAPAPDLEALPGIGPVYAKKIVEGRPYKRKDELVQKKILPQATYDKIKDQIVTKRK